MSFSDTFETHVLTYVFTAGSVTRPTAWHVSLHTGSPLDADSANNEVSTSGTAYTRKSATFTVSGNVASNSSSLEWATATSNFGTVTHIGIYDAATSGNLIAWSALTSSKTIETGDVFRIPSGDLDLTLD